MRELIFTEEYNGQRNPVRKGLMRVMLFTMILLQHALIARASLSKSPLQWHLPRI